MVDTRNSVGLVSLLTRQRPFMISVSVLGLVGCGTASSPNVRIASSNNNFELPSIEALVEKPAILTNSVSKCPSVQATYNVDDNKKDVIFNFMGGSELGNCNKEDPSTGKIYKAIVGVFKWDDNPYSNIRTEDDETLKAWNSILTGTVKSISYKSQEMKYTDSVNDRIWYTYTRTDELRFLGESTYDLNGREFKTRDILYISRMASGSEVNERKYKFAILPDESYLMVEKSKTKNSTDNNMLMKDWHVQHLTNLKYTDRSI